ncbi:hypothetical protein BpHYR1_047199 [Brachionus plicatilis]|uniref:Uncharacterized protein n=1 Tax=Brachionus plicatilis TaxID=10195 RepID=A0A3M7PI00_BRAPC|nr:hypothetical protein BpHYR1_047199 [Brachionus plicatilis]
MFCEEQSKFFKFCECRMVQHSKLHQLSKSANDTFFKKKIKMHSSLIKLKEKNKKKIIKSKLGLIASLEEVLVPQNNNIFGAISLSSFFPT